VEGGLALAGAACEVACGDVADAIEGEGQPVVFDAAKAVAGDESGAAEVALSKGGGGGPTNLYINGGQTASNLTPRLRDTDGLSSFDTLERGVKLGQKGVCIAVSCLADGGLQAVKTGEDPGHYSISPIDPQGLADWLQSRADGTFESNPYTQFLQGNSTVVWNR
jgi:hypothetical protein